MLRSPTAAFALIAFIAAASGCERGPRVDVRGEGPEARRDALRRVERDVRARYPDVEQLAPSTLSDKSGQGPLIVLDVRTHGEYEVGHIADAIRIDPSASADDVINAVGDRLEGATVVFYCSVGERSSRLANRSQARLQSNGAASVFNLEGGVFAWHNSEQPLVDGRGPTPYVHPYNDKWGQLLVHRGRMSTTPRGAR